MTQIMSEGFLERIVSKFTEQLLSSLNMLEKIWKKRLIIKDNRIKDETVKT